MCTRARGYKESVQSYFNVAVNVIILLWVVFSFFYMWVAGILSGSYGIKWWECNPVVLLGIKIYRMIRSKRKWWIVMSIWAGFTIVIVIFHVAVYACATDILRDRGVYVTKALSWWLKEKLCRWKNRVKDCSKKQNKWSTRWEKSPHWNSTLHQ